MESTMMLIISQLLFVDLFEAEAIMSGFSIQQKLETFSTALNRLSLSPKYNEYKKLPGLIRKMQDPRNVIAHGMWMTGDDGPSCSNRLFSNKRYSLSDVAALLIKQQDIQQRLKVLFDDLRDPEVLSVALKAWTERFSQRVPPQ